MQVTTEIPKHLTEQEVSALLGRALPTLRNERSKGCGIPYVKIGRSVRYSAADIAKYLDAHKVRTDKNVAERRVL